MEGQSSDSLLGCGNCGSATVRPRVRRTKAGASTAQVVCARCGAYSELFVGKGAERFAENAWRRRPALLAAQDLPVAVSKSPVAQAVQAGKGEKRCPLELIARMVVGGNFRLPVQGRATVGRITASDVAGAVAMMRDPVAKQAAMAVALRAEGEALVALGRSAARRVFRACRGMGAAAPLRMDDPGDRWRMRLVLHDAVNDLVWPERKVSAQVAAKAAKMRKAAYLSAYTLATGVLRSAVESARREFGSRLFS
ncbi:hypothetical protein FEO92_20200 [Stenotrophomonas maltophilia]|uniref:hypothetical protein n=1 Tax=Stenotrophomonas maltophilia TaxID=40324 RepID=UPI0012B013E1|nr:hypothetical protein [Stenotrophomonas maltophilia]QGL94583.1 hypothetical protein FEO92_20200 [Stenotrophomonas maltophilia]